MSFFMTVRDLIPFIDSDCNVILRNAAQINSVFSWSSCSDIPIDFLDYSVAYFSSYCSNLVFYIYS